MEYNKTQLALIWLDSLNLSFKTKMIICDKTKIENIFEKKFDSELQGLLKPEIVKMLKSCANNDYLKKILLDYKKYNISVITYFDREYPEILKEIDEFPICLYYIGNINLLSKPKIAIVGNRSISEYGEKVTKKLVKNIIDSDIAILGGVSEGVESVAQEESVSYNKSICFMPCSLKTTYPIINENLLNKIKENGLVVSCFPNSYEIHKNSFAIRNKIIGYLSDEIVLIEGSMETGASTIIDAGIESNKPIYAIPSMLFLSRGEYPNYLIKNGYATMLTDFDEVLKNLGIKQNLVANNQNLCLNTEDDAQILIVSLLKDKSLHFDELLELTKLNREILLSSLTYLELSGIIVKLAGNNYSLT
jgi:DNA processing protein